MVGMQDSLQHLANLPAEAFRKADPSPDAAFYRQPRFVTHIDDGAIAAVTAVYREVLPADGDILDLMSSWVSHLPPEVAVPQRRRARHERGGAGREPAPDLAHRAGPERPHPALPFADAAFDGAGLCVSVQYLQRPVEVFREVRRTCCAPGAPFVVSFSNRCFPTKAVAIWQALDGADQQRLVAAYLRTAGFDAIEGRSSLPSGGDPLWVVVGRAPALLPS